MHFGGDGDLTRSEAVGIGGQETVGSVDGFDEEKQKGADCQAPRKIQRSFNEMGKTGIEGALEQCFSTLLMLPPFSTVPHVVGTPPPNQKLTFIASS